jgi:hypothetical protein
MDNQMLDWIRWGIGLVLVSYTRYVHNQIGLEHTERMEAIKQLNERMAVVERQSTTSARDGEMLQKVCDKLDKLANVVYMMAGQAGFKTPE